MGKLQRVAFDGRTAFTTHRLFDAKGPRTIVIDPGSASMIGGVKVALVVAVAVLAGLMIVSPYLMLPLVLVLQRRVRTRIRAITTAWLDRAGNETAGGARP